MRNSSFNFNDGIKHSALLTILFILISSMFLNSSMARFWIFDEGFIVTGAMLVNDGRLPYRDFYSIYGPAQYYLTASIFSFFGEELRFAHYLHIALLSSLGILIYELAVRATNETSSALLLILVYVGLVRFAEPSVGYPAITATVLLASSALSLHKWVNSGKITSLIQTSFLVGMVGLFRWDFGIFSLLALSITLLFQGIHKSRSGQNILLMTWLLTSLFIPILILSIAYIPLLAIFSSTGQWYKEVLVYSITELSKWRNLEYIRPAFFGILSGTPWMFVQSTFMLVWATLPLLASIVGIVTGVKALDRRRAMPSKESGLVLIVYLSFLCLFLLNQLRVRPNLNQGFPSMSITLPLLALLWNFYMHKISHGRLLALLLKASGIFFFIGIILLEGGPKAFFGYENPSLIPFDTPRTEGIRIRTENATYIDLVKYVKSKTSPGEYIYSGVQDHSRLFVNDALLYFLVDRPPADRFMELEPGISNTQKGQEEIISALKQRNVRLIVLGNILSHEANQTSVSNEITTLDEYIRANFYFDRQFGNRAVFIRN